jgi:hypothetical protein
VLRGLVAEIREAGSFEEVATRAVSRIETALHPESVALRMREPGEQSFRALATGEREPPPIPVESTLMALVRLLGKPVEIPPGESGWLTRQLPPQETELLRRARLEWLFPISLATDRTEALLVLGPKRSDEPYSREDQGLIEGITASLGLLLERVQTAAPVPATASPVPSLLAQRFRFERELGRGGMGTVFEAFDTKLERRVAVKLMRPELTADPEAAARFTREARAAAGLSHPNVVIVHDFGVAEDRGAYLVMELLHGRTVRRALEQDGRFAAVRAAEILRGVCAAVEAAHQRQLLHRDLKPENIFLAQSGAGEVPKILDFGLVKVLTPDDRTLSQPGTRAGALLGTLKYMSPEQLRGEPASASWDLWALAVVAYEILAGAYPFAVSEADVWQRAVLAGRVTPLHVHVADAPSSWESFFARALNPESAARPATVPQLFAELEQAVQEAPARTG